jgi:hypothetical protein
MNSNWLYFLLVGFSGIGIAYAAVVLKFWLHWTKNGPKTGATLMIWQLLIITPIGWLLYLVYSSSRLVTLCLSLVAFPLGDELEWSEVG